MYRRELLAHARGHHAAAGTDHLHRLRERRLAAGHVVIVTHALDHTVGAHAAGPFAHARDRILSGHVDHVIRAQLAGHVQTEWLHIANHGEARARSVTENIEHRQSQLARAQDHGGFACLDPAPRKHVMTETVHLGLDPLRGYLPSNFSGSLTENLGVTHEPRDRTARLDGHARPTDTTKEIPAEAERALLAIVILRSHRVILNSDLTALCGVEMSILVVRAFVRFRRFLAAHSELAAKIDGGGGRALSEVVAMRWFLRSVPPPPSPA